jgi:hypothetical protein
VVEFSRFPTHALGCAAGKRIFFPLISSIEGIALQVL